MARPAWIGWRITQKWGVRDSRYMAGYHTGTDFGCPVGSKVKSPGGGTIRRVAYGDKYYGNFVEIMGKGGKRLWLLAHLSRIDVVTGQKVKRRQRIGASGATGNVRGAHLHAEERHAPFGYHDTQKPTAWKLG